MIGRLVIQDDRSETGEVVKQLRMEKEKQVKGGREGRERERERDERDKLVCFVRCCGSCGRSEMGLGYVTCEKEVKELYINAPTPTDGYCHDERLTYSC